MLQPVHKALSGVWLTLCLCLPQMVSANGPVDRPEPAKTHLVHQPDGSIIERLSEVPAGVEYPSFQFPAWAQSFDAWWDAVLEPRPMTALATLPGIRRDEGQKLPEVVDPALVRNWAEFVDPELALRWNALADRSGFFDAKLRLPAAGIGQAHPMVRWPLRTGEPTGSTWRNVVSEGAKRELTGQQALQARLPLPSPFPQHNPWLGNQTGYRY